MGVLRTCASGASRDRGRCGQVSAFGFSNDTWKQHGANAYERNKRLENTKCLTPYA